MVEKESMSEKDAFLTEQIPLRHSVRCFTDTPLQEPTLANLQAFIADCNAQSGLSFTLCVDEPKAFSSKLAHYGSFRNVRNYLACIGNKSEDLQEKVGYWGE